MYEVFRLREEEESSANRDAEGKKPMTREKLRNIFISGVHVLPGLLPRLVACTSQFFVFYFFPSFLYTRT